MYIVLHFLIRLLADKVNKQCHYYHLQFTVLGILFSSATNKQFMQIKIVRETENGDLIASRTYLRIFHRLEHDSYLSRRLHLTSNIITPLVYMPSSRVELFNYTHTHRRVAHQRESRVATYSGPPSRRTPGR